MTPESLREPALTVTVPEVVATMPPKTSAPAPALVIPMPALVTEPLSVSVLPLTVMVRLAPPRLITPLFWVRFAVPVNTRLAPKVIALVIVASTEASRMPPASPRVPAVEPLPPKAKVAEPATSVPAERVVLPV